VVAGDNLKHFILFFKKKKTADDFQPIDYGNAGRALDRHVSPYNSC
jgi:hypothetical protein